MHDLAIRNGTVVDGTGAPARRADVAIDGDRIVAVGNDVGPARQEIDARGLLVAPVNEHFREIGSLPLAWAQQRRCAFE